MSHLALSLLGPFQVTRDGEPVTRFESDTARALLAYLVMQPGVAHRRETLAGLLWPERPDSEALRNLRVALSRLRDAIGDREAEPPFLHITRKTLQFNADSDYWLDARTFGEAIAASKAHGHRQLESCASCMSKLGEAASLYRGDFLAGFSLPSAPFEGWLVVQRESLHLQALDALHHLALYHEGRGASDRALRYARRQVELEPWQESAHRQWMRALASSGQRGMALAQYEACRRILREELGIEPEAETTALYQRIREGVEAPAPSAPPVRALTLPPPPVLSGDAQEVQVSAPPGPFPLEVEGERRRVTVLLASVSGSADLLERVGTEGWAEVMHPMLRGLGAAVDRYGGRVEQYRDHGLVATFGATTAHEDDPERAVLAALAMRETFRANVGRLAGRETQGPGVELRLQVGVNTGEMIVAATGEGVDAARQPGAMRPTALGEALAFAERVQGTVEPGSVWVSESAYRLVEPLFEWQSPAEIAVPGVSHPVAVHRPLAHRRPLDKGRGIAGLESPLVGRQAELRALQDAAEHLWASVGGIVTVVGEAGIGKSRLVAECRGTVIAPVGTTTVPLQWVEGRCLSYATSVAYQVWLDLLRGLLGVAPAAQPDAARAALREQVRAVCADRADEVYPFLGQMLALPPDAEAEARLRGLDAEGLRVLTFRAVETLVECAAQRAPLVLVCEDLHWADPTSLALLGHLLPLTDRVPLLLVCVFRPMTDRGCWQVRESAARDYRHRHTDLWLAPLTGEESAELVGHLLRPLPGLREDLPGDLRARILGHAEGNPFCVEEILRSLIDGGIVVRDQVSGGWHATREIIDIPIPDTLRGVLMARIDRLPGSARHVLQLASVIGRIFERRVLESISRRERELDDDLLALQRGQMIRLRAQLPEITYIFKHQLTQQTAYEGLLRRKRRGLHRRVAEALERVYPERVEEQLGLLAYHWERAGEVERAIPYLRRAGERAAAQFANAEAVAYFSRALDLAPLESVERYALLLARERVYELLGNREAQSRDLAALKRWTETHGDKPKQAEVAVRQAHYSTRIGEYEQAIPAAQAAVRLAQDVQDTGREAIAYREWGRALFYQGKSEAAQSPLERALALAQDAGLRQVEAEVLHTLGNTLGILGNRERQMDCWQQELRICRQIGDRRREGEALRDVGFSLGHRGNWTEGEGYLRQSLNVCRETGNRRDEAWALQFLGGISNYRGQYARARDYIEQGLRICREVHDRHGEREVLWYLGYTHMGLVDYAAARDCLEQSLRISREMNVQRGWPSVALGLVFHLQGDYASARTYYEQAQHIGRESDRWFIQARALMYSGLLSHHLGDNSAALAYGQQALRIIPDLDTLLAVELISVFDVLGHALAGLGRPAEAADAYEQGLTLRRKWRQHHLAVEPLAGLARVALVQGDLAGALAHAGEILDYLCDHPALEGTLEPLRIYLTCYRVLQANGDRRAGELLDDAYHLLQERAARIDDPDLRRSYLENVPAHREIVAAFAAEPRRQDD